MKKFNAYKPLALGALSLMSLLAFAKQEKVIQIFRGGEVIQQYVASDIDYIEVNEIEVLEGSQYEYSVSSLNLERSGAFGSAFFYKNTWDDGCTFTLSSTAVKSYLQLGNSMCIELYVGDKELYNGNEFNVAETTLPFSFKFQYVDMSIGDLVTVVVDNNNHEGAQGTIALVPNLRGSYDAVFDLTMKSGDITLKGYYAGNYMPRNTIYSAADGILGTVQGATLDTSANPCVLYLTTNDGEAGPDNYDVKCEVPAVEWSYGRFMSFSGQDSSVEWIDGVTYSKATEAQTGYYGGNWRVMEPVETPSGNLVTECGIMLYGSPALYLYYYGEIKTINYSSANAYESMQGNWTLTGLDAFDENKETSFAINISVVTDEEDPDYGKVLYLSGFHGRSELVVKADFTYNDAEQKGYINIPFGQPMGSINVGGVGLCDCQFWGLKDMNVYDEGFISATVNSELNKITFVGEIPGYYIAVFSQDGNLLGGLEAIDNVSLSR